MDRRCGGGGTDSQRQRQSSSTRRTGRSGWEGRKRGVDDKEEIADKSRMKEQQQGESGVGTE